MSSINLASPDKAYIRRIFDSIAFRYDFLNSLLSFQLDQGWRKKSLDLVLEPEHQSILDLGVGTGKFLQLFLKAKSWKQAIGLDFSSRMLQSARKALPENVELISADFHEIPLKSASIDLIVSAFTLRSVKDMPGFLKEVYRLLAENGKAAFLCLTRPRNFFWKILYYPYLKFYLPLAGYFFSGDKQAYQFLSKSIQSFQDPEETAGMMREAGFQSLEIHSFTWGAATLIAGKK